MQLYINFSFPHYSLTSLSLMSFPRNTSKYIFTYSLILYTHYIVAYNVRIYIGYGRSSLALPRAQQSLNDSDITVHRNCIHIFEKPQRNYRSLFLTAAAAAARQRARY